MSDIVERLMSYGVRDPMRDEAAAEITALRARLEAVEKERDHNWSEYLSERDARMACNMREATWQARAERAEAALATARRDALATARRVADDAIKMCEDGHPVSAYNVARQVIRAIDKDATP